MSKIEKLIERMMSVPSDFTWDELIKVLTHFGYAELKKGKTGGSRRKFVDEKGNMINLHEPHPRKIMKKYAIEQVLEHLNLK